MSAAWRGACPGVASIGIAAFVAFSCADGREPPAGSSVELVSSEESARAECSAVCAKMQVEGCHVSAERCVRDYCKSPDPCPERTVFLACHEGLPFVCQPAGPTRGTCEVEFQRVVAAGCADAFAAPPDDRNPDEVAPIRSGAGSKGGLTGTAEHRGGAGAAGFPSTGGGAGGAP